MKISEFLERLHGVKQLGPDKWQAKCPSHDDRQASLSISNGEDGRILLFCHAGCEMRTVLESLGLSQKDMFAPQPERDPKPKAKARAKIVQTYDYVDAAGILVYQALRYEPKRFGIRRPDGNDGWIWNGEGVERVPFMLPSCLEAVTGRRAVFVVEGEKDALALQALGLCATTNAGGAEKWLPSMSEALAGAHMVIIPDNDQPGWNHAALVAHLSAELAASIRIITLEGLGPKQDVSDWLAGGHTKSELLALARAAEDIRQHVADSLTDTELMEVLGLDSHPPESSPDEDADEAFKLLSFHQTDLGNAQAFIAAHGADLHFCRGLSKDSFLVWAGNRWIVDERGEAQRRACRTIRESYAKLPSLDHGKIDDLFKHLKRSERSERINAMMMLSRHVSESIPVKADELDADPWLFNVRNGTIDLRTGELRPHRRADLLMKIAPVDYDPTAECGRWMQFLAEVFSNDYELIEYVRRIAGYCLTGSIKEQLLFILMGKGANGKSVLVETLRRMLGDYGTDTAVTTFTERATDASTVALAALYGARMVCAAEGSGDQAWDEALLKKLTGGDPITARHLYCPPITYVPTFKLLVSSNESPRLRGQGYAIKRRVRIIPFKVRFSDPQDGQEPVRDPDLIEKLQAELPGILNWALGGCLAWQQHGLGMPAIVRGETDKLFSDQDPLREWLDDRCDMIPEASTPTRDLWADYLQWCRDNDRQPLKAAPYFSRNLAGRDGIDTYRTSTTRYLTGLQLKPSESDAESAAEAAADEFASLFGDEDAS